MKPVLKKNLVISAQLLVLLALAFFIIQLLLQDRARLAAQELLPTDSASDIIIQRNNEKLVFSKQENTWYMQEPLQGAANSQRLNPLLSLLTLPQSHRYALADLDPQQLGLTPPQAQVSINQLQFNFGGNDVSGKRRYIQIDDGVYLIDDLLLPLINSDTKAFLLPDAT